MKEEGANKEEGGFTFLRVPLKKGITDGGYAEIAPLQEMLGDAKVATNGAFYLMTILTNAREEE